MDYPKFWRILIEILDKHWRPKGRNKSFATCYEVPRRVRAAFRIIFDSGFKITNPNNLKRKHVRAMAHKLEAEGKSPSTIVNMISAMRMFARVIGKPNLVGDSRDFVKDPKSVIRHRATDRDKTWSGAGIDIAKKIAQVTADDPLVGILLELCLAFGLRVREAMKMHPHEADLKTYFDANRGTKGGRRRSIPIEKELQSDVLARAKEMVNDSTGSMIPSEYSLKQFKGHFYYICRKHGISLEKGCVPHGLRHEYANERWEALTGIKSDIKGGDSTTLDPEVDALARITVAEDLGHSRPEITTAYYGSSHKTRKKKENN